MRRASKRVQDSAEKTVRNGDEQFLVGVDARAAALECDRMFFRPLPRCKERC